MLLSLCDDVGARRLTCDEACAILHDTKWAQKAMHCKLSGSILELLENPEESESGIMKALLIISSGFKVRACCRCITQVLSSFSSGVLRCVDLLRYTVTLSLFVCYRSSSFLEVQQSAVSCQLARKARTTRNPSYS